MTEVGIWKVQRKYNKNTMQEVQSILSPNQLMFGSLIWSFVQTQQTLVLLDDYTKYVEIVPIGSANSKCPISDQEVIH